MKQETLVVMLEARHFSDGRFTSYYVLDKMEFLKCEGGGKMKNKKAIVILLIGVMLITTFASAFASLL